MAITKHVKHIRSSVADSIPTTEQLDYGEIAINYSAENERLFIKNANNEIVPFYSGKVIEENEQVTAAALTDLDSRINDIEENNVNTENMESITYSELKSKRDGGELVPGKHYRITDYVTTTSQENTQSAGHQFDVVVLALDEKTLSENAHAMLHEGDTYFSTNGADLSAWELKYCLDNDQSRFAWAVSANRTIEPYDNAFRGCKLVECRQVGDELRLFKNYRNPSSGEENLTDEAEYFVYVGTLDYEGDTYYAWQKKDVGDFQSLILTKTLYQPGTITPNAEPSYVISSDYSDFSGGKGVIYYMKDEWNNECPYDFKNIQFKRKLSNGALDTTNGDDTFVYTFNLWRVNTKKIEDASIIGNTLRNGEGHINGVYGNKINPVSEWSVHSEQTDFEVTQYLLNDIVFLNYDDNDGFFNGCHTNILGYDCFSNTFGNGCYNNSFGNYCYSNTFGYNFRHNTFGNECNNNSFGNYVNRNSFGNYCYSNTFGNGCYNNSFGNYVSRNTFGNECNNNSFGNYVSRNTFGNECNNNSFGNYVNRNTFGNACGSNTFGNECNNNSFGNECNNNSFGNRCWYNTFGNECNNNSFGNRCGSNTFGNECESNTFGNAVNNVTFSKDSTRYVIVENGNQFITLTSTQTTSSSNQLRNITIAQGVNNTTTNKSISHNTVNDTFRTTYQPADSVVVSV